MKLLEKLKRAYDGFIKELAKANEQEFGSKRLDCCDLNKKAGNAR